MNSKKSVNGVVNVNKPAGLTSRQVVDRLKRIYGVKKAGHSGTLDPDATGVLLICLGRATKLFGSLQIGSKKYVECSKGTYIRVLSADIGKDWMRSLPFQFSQNQSQRLFD